jgi:hypothetical protein
MSASTKPPMAMNSSKPSRQIIANSGTSSHPGKVAGPFR